MITGLIYGIDATLSGTGCTATVDGTAAGADDGMVKVTYTNSSHELKISGGNLHLYNVNGCLGLISSGDGAAVTGSYAMAPADDVTAEPPAEVVRDTVTAGTTKPSDSPPVTKGQPPYRTPTP